MLMSVSAAAKELGLSVEHIRRMIRAGRWPVYRMGPKATRIDVEEIRTLGRLMAEAEKKGQRTKEKEKKNVNEQLCR